MVKIEDGEVTLDEGERMARAADEMRTGWEKTIEDMRAMAEDREDEGYEIVKLPADDTAPKPPGVGDDDEWGMTYVVPSGRAETFADIHERASYDETGVYQAKMSGNAFLVTECLDHDEKLAVFVAGAYQLRHATELVNTAIERGEMYTNIKKLDGTKLATIEHDDPSAFFPDPEEYRAYDTEF
jgi:hypothetical protein